MQEKRGFCQAGLFPQMFTARLVRYSMAAEGRGRGFARTPKDWCAGDRRSGEDSRGKESPLSTPLPPP